MIIKWLFISYVFISIAIGCATAKYPIPKPTNKDVKQITIVYDQQMRTWPQKSRTDRIVPAFYLPIQQKAFHLFKSENTKNRTLMLEFNQNDDSSQVQIFAKSLEYRVWLYTDTIINLSKIPVGNSCYKMVIRSYKTREYDFVPVLKLVRFACNEPADQVLINKHLHYNASNDLITGNDKKVYLKNGFRDLFPIIGFRKRDIVKVSDIYD